MNHHTKRIDFRVRPPWKGFRDLALFDPTSGTLNRRGVKPPPSLTERSFDLFLSEMNSAGIDMAVAMGRSDRVGGSVSNDDVSALVQEYPDRFKGFGSINTTNIRGDLREVHRCVEDLGLSGIALDPGIDSHLRADAAQLYPVYALCEQYQIPAAITMSIHVGPDLVHSLPVAIDRVARDFPDLSLIVSHAAWPWTLEMIGVAFRRPNVYLLPDVYMQPKGMPGAMQYVEAANDFLTERMLYGSAYPVRPLVESWAELEALPLSEQAQRMIAYDNPSRLLFPSTD